MTHTPHIPLHPQEQLKQLMKGVHTLVDEATLLDKLTKSFNTQQPLIIKLGLDPSAPDIHLGHAVVLRKMKLFQDLGHQAVIVIGDFTGRIGDPTGKTKGRQALSQEVIKANAVTYCDQIFKILDPEKTLVRFNSEWLSELNFEDVLRLAATTTVARMLERDDFQSRFKTNTPIGLHEFFYPLMQGFDSVALHADVEMGGTDQTFNILMGRAIQKVHHQEQQAALFMPILEGLDGVEKMSKSLGNYIGINEPAEVFFKKVMEVPDDLIIRFFELTTDCHPDEVDVVRLALERGENPRNLKLQLAQILTRQYHSEAAAIQAEDFFQTAFTQKAIPEHMPEMAIEKSSIELSELLAWLVDEKFLKSRSEWHRLIQQSGIQVNGQPLAPDHPLNHLSAGDVIKIGKKRFIKLVQKPHSPDTGIHQ